MTRAHGPVPFRSGRGLRTRCLLAAGAGLTVLLAAGCGGGTSAGGTVSSTITIAAIPGVDTAPLYLAERDGMFAAAGLTHVVIHSYSSEAADLSAVARGQADIAASDYGDIFSAQAKSPDLRILSDGYDATAGVLEVMSWPGSPITSPALLAGQTIGLPDEQLLSDPSGSGQPVSLDSAAAIQVLTNYLGNDAESVNWDPLSQQQEVAALQAHSISAAILSQPYIYEAESQFGATEVFDACSGSTASLPLTGYVATKTWVKDNPAAAADFRAAIVSAQTQASMTGQIQQILPKTTGMSVADADLSTIGSYPTSTSAINLERVVRLMSDLNMFGSGQVPKVPPMIVGPGS
ncbi:MAG: ABC transporter substrate-binding protein [Streptosporangiaceae bacterium]